MDTNDSTGDKAAPGHPEDGLSILDLASLSAVQLQVMRIVLRDVEVSYSVLCDGIDKLPAAEWLSRADLDNILLDLLQKEWLIETSSDQQDRQKFYKAN